MNINTVDLFCGIGGLSYGLKKTGFNITAGIDLDKSCKFAYETNNNTPFIEADITKISSDEIKKYLNGNINILVGCAPCQPFSTHSLKIKKKGNLEKDDSRWPLLYSFANLIEKVKPDIISMENVPQLRKHRVFTDFITKIRSLGYHVHWEIVNCPDFGIPQNRKRLVLLGSRFGPIKLIEKTHNKNNYVNVKQAIGGLPKIKAGTYCKKDILHKSQSLKEINLKRISQSKPGGSWKDWDSSLILECHKKESGKSFSAVYGRMEWEKPSPTITTKFFNYGTGRFGHPEQDRALSLREGAILQTFPNDYKFFKDNQEFSISTIAKHIGNAVPPKLGEVIGLSIKKHLEENKVN